MAEYSISQMRSEIAKHVRAFGEQLSGSHDECTPGWMYTHLMMLRSVNAQLGTAERVLNRNDRAEIGRAFDPAHVADHHKFDAFAKRVEGIFKDAAERGARITQSVQGIAAAVRPAPALTARTPAVS